MSCAWYCRWESVGQGAKRTRFPLIGVRDGPNRPAQTGQHAFVSTFESWHANVACELCEHVAARMPDAPDSEDFFGWHAGTMEYWLHALTAPEARRGSAWASRTEVPYSLALRSVAPNAKWSDGAIGGAGVMFPQ